MHRSFKQLAPLKAAIRARNEEEAAAAAAKQAQQAKQADPSPRDLFIQAVGSVRPLKSIYLEYHQYSDTNNGVIPYSINSQPQQSDDQSDLSDSSDPSDLSNLSDERDISLLLVREAGMLAYRRAGMGSDITRKLRQGYWSVQHQIDLHGLGTEQARSALMRFIHLSHRAGVRCVRVIHGKGLGSVQQTPVLRTKVMRWLVQMRHVQAFIQASPAQGGSGALLVLLNKVPRAQTN